MDSEKGDRSLFEDIIKISEQLIGSREYKGTLAIIVDSLAKLTGADRTCVMIENMDGQFVIKAGYPIGEHGVNMHVTPAIGEEFLRSILAGGGILTVEEPEQDPRTSYMKDLAHDYNLSKVVFVPLAYQGNNLGMLVLDFCRGHEEMHLPLDRVQLLANLAATAIGVEYERRRAKEKMRRIERLSAVGEESSRIAHIIKNSLTPIGGHAQIAERKISGRENKPIEIEIARESLSIVIQEVFALERTVNGILRFSSPGKLHLEPVSINAFIRETASLVVGEMKAVFKCDEALDAITINIDADLVGHAVKDVVINAVQAGATHVQVRTRYSSRRGLIVVEVENNSKKIELGLVDDIFSPFVTTKSSGTGLGLANVKSIMAAHGGDVCLTKNEDGAVVFELSLLL
jgi:signal transduction histidine kinase